MMDKLNIEPRVRSLVSYLSEIEKGIVQIPAFQRDYVWDRDDVKSLFDSIKKRYPVGSILFWRPETKIGENKNKIGSYYIPQQKEAIYILDGFQRLSTLFGCLTNPKKTKLNRDDAEWEENFSLYYDLEEETFLYIRPHIKHHPYQVPVYIFMSSSDFRQYARREFEKVADEEKIEIYYDRADKLSRVLLEYQIASIDINHANIEEAVDIFSRVNSKGLDISFDWMANALSIQDGFRFGTEIDKLLEDLRPYNFDKIDRNAVFRCIQSSFGKLYIDNQNIEGIAKRKDFSEVTRATIPKIKEAVQFLFEELLVVESRLLPYNIQLIFIMDFFKKFPSPTPEQKQQLKRWFWITSYSNYFTLYSLANQRRAYYHFKAWLAGEKEDPVYNDEPKVNFQTGGLPEKLSMGSVRAKTMTLFMLNYAQGFKQIKHNDVVGLRSFKMFGGIAHPANTVPFLVLGYELSLEKDLFIWERSNDLFTQDKSYNWERMAKYFFSENIIEKYRIFKDTIALVADRRDLIERLESDFVRGLGIDYKYTNDLLNLI